MKAIFDRLPSVKKFPLSDLLQAIQTVIQNPQVQPVWICRLGGVGRGIWAYESQLDEGNDVVVTFSDVQKLAESSEDCLDELWGKMGRIHFGIRDSSFLFVQCEDKDVEQKIVSGFEAVQEIPDIIPPQAPVSPPQ